MSFSSPKWSSCRWRVILITQRYAWDSQWWDGKLLKPDHNLESTHHLQKKLPSKTRLNVLAMLLIFGLSHANPYYFIKMHRSFWWLFRFSYLRNKLTFSGFWKVCVNFFGGMYKIQKSYWVINLLQHFTPSRLFLTQGRTKKHETSKLLPPLPPILEFIMAKWMIFECVQ